MNEIAFIICTNNSQYYEECVRYIMELRVPEGYTTDIICIQEADSMAQGYNAGMNASEAKYKIYLHQDTFITNRDFLSHMLEIFQKDNTIGMLGVVGTTHLSTEIGGREEWDMGALDEYDGRYLNETTCYGEMQGRDFAEVEAVGDILIATQYDVPWREDVLERWTRCGVWQSLEMKERGYKVVVPKQKSPWCYHDGGSVFQGLFWGGGDGQSDCAAERRDGKDYRGGVCWLI